MGLGLVGAQTLGIILGVYWDNGEYNGDYCLGFRVPPFKVQLQLRLFVGEL